MRVRRSLLCAAVMAALLTLGTSVPTLCAGSTVKTKPSTKPKPKPVVNIQALKDRAVAEVKAGKNDAAIVDYTRILGAKPGDFDALFGRGTLYHVKGLYAESVSDLRAAAKLKPTSHEVWTELGLALHDAKEFSEASAALGEAIKTMPDSATLYYSRGLALVSSGNLDAALADFSQAVALDSDYAEAYYRRGLCHADKGELAHAIADYGKALECKPQYAEAWGARGDAFIRSGRFDESIADYSSALLLPGKRARRLVDRARAYLSAPEPEHGLVLEGAWATEDGQRETKCQVEYLDNPSSFQNDPSSYEWSEQVLEMAFARPDVLGYAGYITKGKVKYKEGEYYLVLSATEPTDRIAVRRNVAQLWTMSSEHRIVTKLKLRDYTFDPREGSSLVFRVHCTGYVYQKGKGKVVFPSGKTVTLDDQGSDYPVAALADIDAAIAEDTSLAEAYYCRGQVLERMNSNKEALAAYRKFLELSKDKSDASNEEAKKRVAELEKPAEPAQSPGDLPKP